MSKSLKFIFKNEPGPAGPQGEPGSSALNLALQLGNVAYIQSKKGNDETGQLASLTYPFATYAGAAHKIKSQGIPHPSPYDIWVVFLQAGTLVEKVYAQPFIYLVGEDLGASILQGIINARDIRYWWHSFEYRNLTINTRGGAISKVKILEGDFAKPKHKPVLAVKQGKGSTGTVTGTTVNVNVSLDSVNVAPSTSTVPVLTVLSIGTVTVDYGTQPSPPSPPAGQIPISPPTSSSNTLSNSQIIIQDNSPPPTTNNTPLGISVLLAQNSEPILAALTNTTLTSRVTLSNTNITMRSKHRIPANKIHSLSSMLQNTHGVCVAKQNAIRVIAPGNDGVVALQHTEVAAGASTGHYSLNNIMTHDTHSDEKEKPDTGFNTSVFLTGAKAPHNSVTHSNTHFYSKSIEPMQMLAPKSSLPSLSGESDSDDNAVQVRCSDDTHNGNGATRVPLSKAILSKEGRIILDPSLNEFTHKQAAMRSIAGRDQVNTTAAIRSLGSFFFSEKAQPITQGVNILNPSSANGFLYNLQLVNEKNGREQVLHLISNVTAEVHAAPGFKIYLLEASMDPRTYSFMRISSSLLAPEPFGSDFKNLGLVSRVKLTDNSTIPIPLVSSVTPPKLHELSLESNNSVNERSTQRYIEQGATIALALCSGGGGGAPINLFSTAANSGVLLLALLKFNKGALLRFVVGGAGIPSLVAKATGSLPGSLIPPGNGGDTNLIASVGAETQAINVPGGLGANNNPVLAQIPVLSNGDIFTVVSSAYYQALNGGAFTIAPNTIFPALEGSNPSQAPLGNFLGGSAGVVLACEMIKIYGEGGLIGLPDIVPAANPSSGGFSYMEARL